MDSPIGLGDPALGGKLMSGMHVDHSPQRCGRLAIPSSPAQLCSLVKGMAKDQHQQEQTLHNLRKALEDKERQLDEKERQWACERQALKAGHEVRDGPRRRSSWPTVWKWLPCVTRWTSTNAPPPLPGLPPPPSLNPNLNPTHLSIRSLVSGPCNWLRFYTVFGSYGRFKALLRFRQGAERTELFD